MRKTSCYVSSKTQQSRAAFIWRNSHSIFYYSTTKNIDYLTGKSQLRQKISSEIEKFSKVTTLSVRHFFCAKGAPYVADGPYRPWCTFTSHTDPRHFQHLSDPCFFDDFAGVMVPHSLQLDRFIDTCLPLTPEERRKHGRLQPVGGRVGIHPNFSSQKRNNFMRNRQIELDGHITVVDPDHDDHHGLPSDTQDPNDSLQSSHVDQNQRKLVPATHTGLSRSPRDSYALCSSMFEM